MEQVNLALEPLRAMLAQLGEFLPKLLMAVAILIAGWLLAKVLRFVVVRGLKSVNFHVLAERSGIDGFLRQGGTKLDTTGVLGLLIYWLLILAALMVAFNGLGLAYVAELVGRVLLFVPRVIVAILILALGAYFSRFLASSVTTYFRNIGVEDAALFGKLTLYAVMTFVVLIAIDQINIGGDLIVQSFLILLAGVVLAAALAFGLGGQKRAADMLERWTLKKPGKEK